MHRAGAGRSLARSARVPHSTEDAPWARAQHPQAAPRPHHRHHCPHGARTAGSGVCARAFMYVHVRVRLRAHSCAPGGPAANRHPIACLRWQTSLVHWQWGRHKAGGGAKTSGTGWQHLDHGDAGRDVPGGVVHRKALGRERALLELLRSLQAGHARRGLQ